MNGKLLLYTVAISGSLFASCNKDDDDNTAAVPVTSTSGAADMGYQLRTINPLVDTDPNTPYGTIQWTSGFANPREIKFEAKPSGSTGIGNGNGHGNGHGNGNGNNGSKDKIEYKSTYAGQIDLFAPISTVFGNFTLPPGTYKEIELKMKLDGDNTVPALELNGMYTGNNMPPIPIVFQVPHDVELKTELKDVTIDNNTIFSAITSLDLISLMSGVTPVMLQNVQLTNGTVLISPTSNRHLYDHIMDNLKSKRHGFQIKKDK
jgi:hypothetical protein